MKPTTPLRCEFGEIATTPWRRLSLSRLGAMGEVLRGRGQGKPLKIAVAPHTKFKDAEAIANAIGCAPLPENTHPELSNPVAGTRFAVRSRKNPNDGPNWIVSPFFNSASVIKSPLTVSRSLNLILQRIGIAGSQKHGVLR